MDHASPRAAPKASPEKSDAGDGPRADGGYSDTHLDRGCPALRGGREKVGGII
jgi:hypothetical protein